MAHGPIDRPTSSCIFYANLASFVSRSRARERAGMAQSLPPRRHSINIKLVWEEPLQERSVQGIKKPQFVLYAQLAINFKGRGD